MEKQLEEQERSNRALIDDLKSEPLLRKEKKIHDTPNWRKKKVRQIALAVQPKPEEEEEDAQSEKDKQIL